MDEATAERLREVLSRQFLRREPMPGGFFAHDIDHKLSSGPLKYIEGPDGLRYTFPVSTQLMRDMGLMLWTAVDRNPFPQFDLFPLASRARRVGVEAWDRVSFAAGVLRDGVPDDEGDW